MLVKAKKLLHRITQIFYLTKSEKQFIAFAKKNRIDNVKSHEGEMLIDIMDDHSYMFQSFFIGNFFKKEFGLTIKTVLPSYGKNRKLWYKYMYPMTRLARLYKGLNYDMAFTFHELSESSINELKWRAKKSFDSLNSKDDLVALKIENIHVGDLIYDSYMRDHAVGTVDIKSHHLLYLLERAFIIFQSCTNYLESANVKKIVLSHSVYIQYGILARIAVSKKINIYMFSRWHTQVIHKLTSAHYMQTRDHSKYREKFQLLDNKSARLEQAREILSSRLTGKIDAGTSYMRSSAYSSNKDFTTKIFKDSGKTRILIMLHCFFDSPHIYKSMIFPDFCEWLDCTLNIAEKTNADVYVKPHPNGLPGNEAIIDEFRKKYPGVSFLDKTVSNNQLMSEGIDAAITVYGTVAHEFAYNNIPVICAGDNPHSMYNFCHQAHDKEEYKKLIHKAGNFSKDISKTEIEEFFYMHYLHADDGRVEGSNDIFYLGKTQSGPDQLSLLVNEALDGRFTDIDSKIQQSLNQLDEHA